MSEKTRPGYVPPVASVVGVTPNPAAAGISWPMSFPSANSSYERSSMASFKGQISAQSPGTRYDPVRHTDFISAAPSLPGPFPPNDSFAASQKRKRDDDMRASSAHGGEDYRYEPQKIVTPTNSLQSGKRNHVCDICGATFTRQHNLKSHFLTHTSSKKEFICSECGSEFRRSHDLKRHQKLHTGEKPFACLTCGRRFARADALGRHAKSSGEAGCVNSRRTSSDPGGATNTADYRLPSPTAQDETHHEHRAQRSRTNSLHISTVTSGDRTNSSSSSTQTSPRDSGRSASHNLFSQNMNPRSAHDALQVPLDHTTLPPLQTALGIESERYHETLPAPQESGYLAAQRFGLSSAFDSRPPSTHPLSFDRGPAATDADGGGPLASAPSLDSGTVPLQRYRQLEAEHRDAMERIKRFELSKRDSSSSTGGGGDSSSSSHRDGPSSARDEGRPVERALGT